MKSFLFEKVIIGQPEIVFIYFVLLNYI